MTPEHDKLQIANYQTLHNDRPHQVAVTEVNAKMLHIAQASGLGDIRRGFIPEGYEKWPTPYENYRPIWVDLPRGATQFRKPGDNSHPSNPNAVLGFTSLEATFVRRDDDGYPLNPIGRTGIRGRGILDKWGPTLAADPIVTRNNPENGRREVLLIAREDTGEWALPGGKVDDGEQAWEAAGRELMEEAGVGKVLLDFSTARTVYAGYSDDSRNTDNAWMEVSALHLHLTSEQAESVTLQAGSDATAAWWQPMTEDLYPHMFAAQGSYLRLAA